MAPSSDLKPRNTGGASVKSRYCMNQSVIAKFGADNVWYRAVVISVQGNQYSVRLVIIVVYKHRGP